MISRANEKTYRIVDPALEKIERQVTPDFVQNEYRRAVRTISERVERPPRSFLRGEIAAKEAFPWLNRVRDQLERFINDNSSHLHPFQVKWFLRRLRTPFGKHRHTLRLFWEGLDIAEQIVTCSHERGSFVGRELPSLDYEVSEHAVRSVVRHWCLAVALQNVQAAIRGAAFGFSFKFDTGRSFSQCHIPEPTTFIPNTIGAYDNARQLYIARFDGYGSFFRGIGTIVSSDEIDPSESVHIFARVSGRLEEPLPWYIDSDGKTVRLSTRVQYLDHTFKLDRLRQLTADDRLLHAQVATEDSVALYCFLRFVGHSAHFNPSMTPQARQLGYVVVPKEMVSRYFDINFDHEISACQQLFANVTLPDSSETLLNRLESTTGSVWPYEPSGFIYNYDEFLVIDVGTASKAMTQSIRFPAEQGAVANARADHFELVTRQSIKQTRWKASDDIGDLEGKVLRRNGKALTDVDAIGEFRNRLLLVSCKSFLADPGLSNADHKEVRNLASKIAVALDELDELLQSLRKNPIGDNFDLRRFDHIIGVVCTPMPLFVADPHASRWAADGLHSYVCLPELLEWLDGGPSAPGASRRRLI